VRHEKSRQYLRAAFAVAIQLEALARIIEGIRHGGVEGELGVEGAGDRGANRRGIYGRAITRYSLSASSGNPASAA